jgi:acylpyruvate hydrolase
MRLMRAALPQGERVLGSFDGTTAVATVSGREFEDLPELLDACAGDPAAIAPGQQVEVTDDELLGVPANPRKIVCIGLNYRLHAEESGMPLPAAPMLFPKWATSLTGPHDEIPLPPESQQVDWESELAFVFSRRCRRVRAEQAGDVVFGYTAANDVSMRDYQFHTTQFAPGKIWDRSTPVGPVIVTADELGGTEPNLAITGRLNGDLLQDSRTDDLIFGIPQLVEYLTTIMTMEPGDLVLTGTPSGVGQSAKPPRFLADGDVYEVEIEGIGRLTNRFRAE